MNWLLMVVYHRSLLVNALMVVNDNGTVDLKLANGNIINLIVHYNAHNGVKVPKASQSICQ